ASAERVFEFLGAPEETPDRIGATAPHATRGHVEFDRVSFRYLPDKALIEDFSLDVRPGETVAIVGPTGAGKTTIVNLLMRFYEIDGGSICLDGVDTRELPRDVVRRTFGMVLQDTWLFAGTIRDNIAYGKEGPTMGQSVAMARLRHGRTGFVIAHRLSTIRNADTIVVMDEGRIVEQGTHADLLRRRGFYYELYRSQFDESVGAEAVAS